MTSPDPFLPDHDGGASLHISCSGCVMARTPTCRDCLVTHLFEHDEAGGYGAVESEELDLDESEIVAIGVLQRAGLAPRLRHVPLVSILPGPPAGEPGRWHRVS